MNGRDEIVRAVEGAQVLQFPRAQRAHAGAEGGSDAIETPKAADLPSNAGASAGASAVAA